MKKYIAMLWGLMVTVGATLLAQAQQEQWLQYRTSTEPRGYRWVQLSTNPPAGVALPKLRASALYGRWTDGLDGGRWFCMDRATRSGPCDRMFFDCNGNGRLDDDPAIKVSRRESNMGGFDPIKVVFKGEDGPVSYHLIARHYQFGDDQSQLLIGAGGWYEGNITLEGKKRKVKLIDNNVNGAFNDIGASAYETDEMEIAGEKEPLRYLGKYVELDNQLWALEVAKDGAFLKLKKAEGVPLGPVRVPETITDFVAVGSNGHFVRKPASGEFKLPVGTYHVHRWNLDRKDERGTAWSLIGSARYDAAGEFVVSSDQPVHLAVGEPIRTVVEASESRSLVSFSLQLKGPLGETVELKRGTEQPRAPQLHVKSLVKDFRSTNSFEYG
jgi:hypothetical protein